MAGLYLEIDASSLTSDLERLEAVMKPEQFQRAMIRIRQRGKEKDRSGVQGIRRRAWLDRAEKKIPRKFKDC